MDLTDTQYFSTQLEAYSSQGQPNLRDRYEAEQTFNNVFHAPTSRDLGESQTQAPEAGSHREKQKRTPPDVEAALRRYNREGITKWDVILERLKSETPPIVIKRSTLGQYLKECNIGSARRKNLGEDEMRELVLQELNQPLGRKRGVRKVWEALKSKGHHIRREFVEKVMKDVDPNGFVERRPRWKPVTIAGLPDAGQAPLPLSGPSAPSTSPQHHAHVTAPPLTMDRSTDTFGGMAAQTVSQSLPYSNAYLILNPQPPGFEIFQPEGFTGGNLSFPTCVPEGVGRGGIVDGVGEDWNMDSDSAPLVNSGVSGTAMRSSTVDRHARDDLVTTHSLFMDFQEDAPPFDDRGHSQVQHSQSDNAGETCMALGISTAVLMPTQSGPQTNNASVGAPGTSRNARELLHRSFRLPILMCVVDSATDGATGSGIGGRDGRSHELVSLRLKITIKDLFARLDDWCIALLEHTNESEQSRRAPNSHTRWTSIEAYDATRKSKGYIPDYNVSEEEVATGALSLALALSRTLSCPQSCENIAVVADQLWIVQGMLRDIGIQKEVLQDLGKARLKCAEFTARTFGNEKWVLHVLWQCAADGVFDGWDDLHERREVAAKAANAARQLIPLSSKHTNFYHACSLHYDAICCDLYSLNKKAYDKVTQAVDLFRDAVPATFSSAHLEEMMRAMRSQSMSKHYRCEDMKVVYDQTLVDPSDPTWAMLCTEISRNIDPEKLDNDSLEMALCLETHAIDALQSYQHARPTRIPRLIAGVLVARCQCLVASARGSEAIQSREEAIYIHTRVANISQGDLDALGEFVENCLDHQLELQKWEDALVTRKRYMDIVESHPRIKRKILTSGVFAFQLHLEAYRNLTAISAACALIDTLRPLLRSNHPSGLLLQLVDILVTISDIRREIGEFQAALVTSREALAVVRGLMSQYTGSYNPIEALACHANCLVDDDAYDDATALFPESSITSSDDASSLAPSLGRFGVVHAHAAIAGRPSCIDEVISASDTDPSDCARPYWLFGHNIFEDGGGKRGWLLLIRSVMECTLCTTSPSQALTSAKESLALMSQYYERNGADMEPHAKASVLGHKYILLSILGESEQGLSVLNESVTQFRRALDDDDTGMVRLPLIIFLDILLVLFRPLPFRFETSTLQRWKKSVYKGSTGFFDDFVALLEGLPHYIHAKCSGEHATRSGAVSITSFLA